MEGDTFYSKEFTLLKSVPYFDWLRSGILCAVIILVLYWIKKIFYPNLFDPYLPGLKTPLFSLFGSFYTFPSSSTMARLSLSITGFMVQTFSGHWKLFEKEKLFYFDAGPIRYIFLAKPEAVEELLRNSALLEKAWAYKFLHPWLGTGLLTSSGSKWRSRRKLLTPSFHFDILKDFLPIFDKQSKVLVDILKKTVDEPFVNAVTPVTLCALDIICESTLGVHLGAQTNSESEYVQAVLRTSQTLMDRMFNPKTWFEPAFRLTAVGRQFTKDLNILHTFTKKVIHQKKNERKALKFPSGQEEENSTSSNEFKRKRKALMDLLLDHHIKNQDITEEDIREEVDTFTFEGHDTTSMGISWALYLIGLYPDVQAKIHEELDAIFGSDLDRDVTMDDLRDMRYLECVLKESQRLYPSVPMFGRQIERDANICGTKIKKGSTLVVFTYSLHRDPKAFPEPEKFDPDRFLPENYSSIHPFAYIPFSAGPRNCIGQRFAMMEEKTVVSNVLRNFQLKSLDERDKILLSLEMILRPACPLRMKFTPRASSTADK